MISVGSGSEGEVVVNGGYALDNKGQKKATADTIYRGKTATNVIYDIDTIAGNDVIVGYKDGDIIQITTADSSQTSLDFSNTKVIKDGGTGKDLSITYNGTNKITLKQNTETRVELSINGNPQVYGTNLPSGVTFNSNRTALTVAEKNVTETVLGIEGWTSEGYEGGSGSAMQELAPKLNTIDASKAKIAMKLTGMAEKSSVLKGGTVATTMIGGTAADQFTGGTGNDVFVFKLDSLGGGIGKDVINNYNSGTGKTPKQDIIVLDLAAVDGNETLRTDAFNVEISSKGVVTFLDTSDKANATSNKNNMITIKDFSKSSTVSPVIVADTNGKVLAVNSKDGVPAPTGMSYNTRTGITTTRYYNGSYGSKTYHKDAKINLATGEIVNAADGSATYAAIDAADYGGAVKAINASVVSDQIKRLTITGNAATKNTIYTPVIKAGQSDHVTVDVYGGSAADVIYGDSSSTVTTVFFNVNADGGGKDIIWNYKEGDQIYVKGYASLSPEDRTGTGTDGGIIVEKGNDVIVNFDKSNTLTLKNAVGKTISFSMPSVEGAGNRRVQTYGHTLPTGLEYDSKRVAINAEACKTDRDEETLKQLNAEMRTAYSDIMNNEHMKAYNDAKQNFDKVLQRVLAIVQNSADGEDPDTTDFSEDCTHDCSTCGGCG